MLAQNHRQNADSVVVFFLGDDVFQRYVNLNTEKSKRLTSNAYLFQYNFRHPKFSGETFVIAFTLDSTGRFNQGEETRGLIHMLSNSDSTWINARQALHICRDQAHRIKKRSLRLAWDSTAVSFDVFQKTNDFRDIVPGHLVWEVDGEVIFRGQRYSGTFEVNVLTGAVARRFAIPWD